MILRWNRIGSGSYDDYLMVYGSCQSSQAVQKCFKSCLFWIRRIRLEFAGFGESGEFKGGLGNDVFGTQKREWTNSVIGLASRECIRNGWPSWNCRTSLPSQKYVIWIWSFFGKKNFFFEKFVIFLKNLSMGKSRKWHQKMFLRWNQKRSGFSNPFRPPGIVGEVSADTRSSKISIRRIRWFCMLNSPDSPKSANPANWWRIEKLLRNRINFDFQNFKSRIYRDLLYVHGTSLGFSNGLHLRYQPGKEWKIHENQCKQTFFCGLSHSVF